MRQPAVAMAAWQWTSSHDLFRFTAAQLIVPAGGGTAPLRGQKAEK
jgi:hypothetical protein